MQTYYASLVRGLSGYYVKFTAPNETIVRKHLVMYFGRLWCSVYTAEEMEKLKAKFPGKVINEDRPIELTTEEWE